MLFHFIANSLFPLVKTRYASHQGSTYLRKDHQDIIGGESLDLDLCKDPQDDDHRRNDHRRPDAFLQRLPFAVLHSDRAGIVVETRERERTRWGKNRNQKNIKGRNTRQNPPLDS